MRSIEEVAAEEDARLRQVRGEQFARFCRWASLGLGLWSWTVFYQGQMGKGALGIVFSLLLLGFGLGLGAALRISFPAFFLGLLAGAGPLLLYLSTRLPFFYWGKDPDFWLSVHAGAVTEPSWSPLSYLLGQSACFLFPSRVFTLLPELSGFVLSVALFFVMTGFYSRIKNKSATTSGLGLMFCWLISVSLPFWNAATIGMGLVTSLGFFIYLVQKSLLNLEERPWAALYLLLGLLWSVHPLWGLFGLIAHEAAMDKEGKSWSRYLFPLFVGFTPYLWIGFRANRFFPSWGGENLFWEFVRQWKSDWKDLLGGDWDLKGATEAWGWIPAALLLLAVFLLFLNFFKWKAGNKPLLPAVDFWLWLTSGIVGVLFFSLKTGFLAPISVVFLFGLAEFNLRLLERGIEKKHSNLFSGTRLVGVAAVAIFAMFGLAFLPGQSYFRNQFYFPEQHALNLLKILEGRSLLVCEDSFEAAACLEARLIEPVALQAVILDKRYLNQRWYVSQCILRAPQLLFSNIQGLPDDVLRNLIRDNRDQWAIHWGLSVLPAGWKDPKAFPTVLTQVFEGKATGPQSPEELQYHLDLTALPRMNETVNSLTNHYFFRYAEGFNELGKNLMGRGFYLASIHAFDRALKLNPSYAEPQTYLSQMYSQQKILEAAQLEFEKTIDTHPGKIGVLLGELEQDQKEGNEAKSVTVLDNMIRMNAELADAQYQLSVIYNHQGKTQESKSLLESSIQLNPKQIESQMTLGHLMSRMGNRLKAEEAFRAVLGINPENKEAQVELWKLLNKP